MKVLASPIRVNPPCFTARGGSCHSPHPIVSAVRIYAGSDHAGVKLKTLLVAELRRAGHQVVDLGTGSQEATDYPDWAAQVARAVRDDGDPASARG
jgi:hypothetical protein